MGFNLQHNGAITQEISDPFTFMVSLLTIMVVVIVLPIIERQWMIMLVHSIVSVFLPLVCSKQKP